MKRGRKHTSNIGVYADHQRRTCILVSDGEPVKYIPLDISGGGLRVHTTTLASFTSRYTKLPDYPIEKAKQLYLNFAKSVGATAEAVEHLSKHVVFTEEDREMVLNRVSAAEKIFKKSAREHRTKSRKVASEPVKRRQRVKKVASEPSGRYVSVKEMVEALVKGGRTITDDDLFKRVQKEFRLADTKRPFIRRCHRNILKESKQ